MDKQSVDNFLSVIIGWSLFIAPYFIVFLFITSLPHLVAFTTPTTPSSYYNGCLTKAPQFHPNNEPPFHRIMPQ